MAQLARFAKELGFADARGRSFTGVQNDKDELCLPFVILSVAKNPSRLAGGEQSFRYTLPIVTNVNDS